MTWIVEPYVGVGALKFGMTPDAVTAIIGPARKQIERSPGRIMEYRKGLETPIVRFNNGVLDEVTFTRFTKDLFVENVNVFNADPVRFILLIQSLDDDLRERSDAIISYKLGISFTGLYPEEESDKGLAAFARGVFDRHREKSTAFRLAI
jgi:hypothetical protein